MQATESSEIKQYIDSRILVNEEKKKSLSPLHRCIKKSVERNRKCAAEWVRSDNSRPLSPLIPLGLAQRIVYRSP